MRCPAATNTSICCHPRSQPAAAAAVWEDGWAAGRREVAHSTPFQECPDSRVIRPRISGLKSSDQHLGPSFLSPFSLPSPPDARLTVLGDRTMVAACVYLLLCSCVPRLVGFLPHILNLTCVTSVAADEGIFVFFVSFLLLCNAVSLLTCLFPFVQSSEASSVLSPPFLSFPPPLLFCVFCLHVFSILSACVCVFLTIFQPL